MASTGTSNDDKEQIMGVIAAKTRQAVLIGEYNASTQAAETADVIERLATYLMENNY
jgi:hypothetical protein